MITRCRPLLGTMVEITVEDHDASAIDAAFAAIGHIHVRMSFHEPTSDVALLRAAPAGEIVEVDRETVAVLRMAIAFHQATDGLFDVAVGRALVRTRFLPRDGIMRLDRFPGTTADIEILDDRHVQSRRRVLLDLGGIAKGHAVDRAVETLIAAGARTGLVNAGGDLSMFGDREWQIQLRDADDVVRQGLTARGCAIASSANLLNRKSVRGQLCAPHIGRSGEPILIDHRVTVIAEQCIIADAMTKVAMVDPDLADTILAVHKGYVLRMPLLAGVA
ncbi:MAG: FAD:protein FMN transferase [Sphingomonas sp.]|uniref:FAD:protein FMN transferase n=1 Tax=Sphingomonas sp. TaxID=28214 RepID=UPI003F36B830